MDRRSKPIMRCLQHAILIVSLTIAIGVDAEGPALAPPLPAEARLTVDENDHLIAIDLSACTAPNAGLAALSGSVHLRTVVLPARVTDLGLTHLGTLASVEALDLRPHREISDDGLEHLGGMTSLKRLSLPAQVSDAGIAHVGTISALSELDLSSCRHITNDGLAHLERTTGLRLLDISGTRVDTLSTIARLRNLQVLRLRGTVVRELKPLESFAHLQVLDVSDTPISSKEIRHLEALDDLQILSLIHI